MSGTSGNDTLSGGGGADSLAGLGGDDRIDGHGQSDQLYGGAGDDTVYGGSDDDTLYGGDGNDQLYGGGGQDRIWGDAGDDWIDGGNDADTIFAGGGNNSVQGSGGEDRIYSGSGNDTIDGGADGDDIFAGHGDNVLYGDAGEDELNTGRGADTVYGGADGDSLFTGSGNDVLYGGHGQDFLSSGPGDDTLYGGADNDEFFLRDGSGTVTVADFDAVNETIRIHTSSVTSFSDVSARMTDDGTDTTIVLDDGATMVLRSVLVSQLSSSNFVFGQAVCYMKGTLIATPRGPVPIETLSVGDTVSTWDEGTQTIRWIGRSHHRFDSADDRFKPIQIKSGALGGGRPNRDLFVSPQHRLVASGLLVRRLFGRSEVLALAKGLTGLPGIRLMSGKKSAT